MSCARCGGDYKIESHHIIHRVNGGKDTPENMVDLCRHCHKYQHTKEKLIDALEYYLNDARNVFRGMKPKYIREHVELTLKRLEYLEQENTPLQIQARGYYPYWNNKDLHLIQKERRMTNDELVLKVKDIVDDYENFLYSDPYQLYEAIAEFIEKYGEVNA